MSGRASRLTERYIGSAARFLAGLQACQLSAETGPKLDRRVSTCTHNVTATVRMGLSRASISVIVS